jgi:hypothetical protein
MLRSCFFEWKAKTEETRRAIFEEIRQEEESERLYAEETGMDSIYWCWNCKHCMCDIESHYKSVDYDSDSETEFGIPFGHSVDFDY